MGKSLHMLFKKYLKGVVCVQVVSVVHYSANSRQVVPAQNKDLLHSDEEHEIQPYRICAKCPGAIQLTFLCINLDTKLCTIL